MNHLLLVTAHPDDEVMFFVPTILGYKKKHILCLSTGDYNGLGCTRSKELYGACKQLFILNENITLVDDVKLQDGKTKWECDDIMHHVDRKIKAMCDQSNVDRNSRVQCIDIVTFDIFGVSGHNNHIDIFLALNEKRSSIAKLYPCVNIYFLESHSFMYKYSGLGYFIYNVCRNGTVVGTTSATTTFVNPSPSFVYKALYEHHSQFVWYRLLFVLLSIYSWKNVLRDHCHHGRYMDPTDAGYRA